MIARTTPLTVFLLPPLPAFAFRLLYKGRYTESKWRMFETGLSVIMLIVGLFLLGGGTYASVASIIHSYNVGAVKAPFQVRPVRVWLRHGLALTSAHFSSRSAPTPASSSRARRAP